MGGREGAEFTWVSAPPLLQILSDGSYRSVLANPKIGGKARQVLIDAARVGDDLDEGKANAVRVIEYEVPGCDGEGKGELIVLITIITDLRAAPARCSRRQIASCHRE